MNASITTTVLISTIVILILHAKTARCCGGYELEIDYIRNCDSENIVELSDKFTVVLKSNCQVYINGCITTYANITSATVEFTVQKDLIKLSGKRDGCKQLDDAKSSTDIQMALEILGLPKSCPINKGTVCFGNKPINVRKYKLQMNVLAGNLKGKSVTTTNGGKTCMEFSAKLVNVFMKAIGRGVIG
ncbi:PREDICTED: uncharacterized protein LOC107168107 [Diuraphis noxia]|uniref:uncharacterized protein LOC107168107 n=1 Tax=Diuraphis noxia TaxID=143948 RepID=UPI000763788C|nr:PREDICTED: uncharacterized protein LOC107168107 [Diuraphis noxia]